jgi:hypothetical protein
VSAHVVPDGQVFGGSVSEHRSCESTVTQPIRLQCTSQPQVPDPQRPHGASSPATEQSHAVKRPFLQVQRPLRQSRSTSWMHALWSRPLVPLHRSSIVV